MRIAIGAAVVAVAFHAAPALAREGDTYRCIVRDFTAVAPNSTEDKRGFIEMNKAKRFDIIEFKDRFTVLSACAGAACKKGATDYEIVKDDGFGAMGRAAYSYALNHFVLARPPKNSMEATVPASIVIQGSESVNTWFLDCIPQVD